MQPLRTADQAPLFRIVTAGSVDDGKSSLIGRLLYDAGALPDDQIELLQDRARRDGASAIDLSLITDGLIAEREQGITIDVAYRYFQTARRKFIVADTPGHVQYVRNMVTGASTADAAIVLVDVRKGMTEQTRRHLCIASLLRIPHLIIAVNKMDLVSYDRSIFERAAESVRSFLATLGDARAIVLPIAAKHGDNVVRPAGRMEWYEGPSLLDLLESLPAPRGSATSDFRLPVQLVQRDRDDNGDPIRRILGRIESGRIAVGDPVEVLPGRQRARIKSIDTFDRALSHAEAPLSISLTLEDDVDIGRGDLLAAVGATPRIGTRFEALLCWLDENALSPDDRLVLKHGTRTIPAKIERVLGRLDVSSLRTVPSDAPPAQNDLVSVVIRAAQPFAYDAYRDARRTGGFILMSERSNATVAAGLIQA